jgi:hypothetical protein
VIPSEVEQYMDLLGCGPRETNGLSLEIEVDIDKFNKAQEKKGATNKYMDINEIYKDENKDDDNSDGSGAEIQMLDIINKFSKKETAAESNLLKDLETLDINKY